MNFLYPSFFWALFLIAIPVIIHLFNFRVYKTVYFSNIRFLQNIKDVSESKSKIKHLVLLLIRIFAIIALITAFAGPYIPLVKKTDKKLESIVLIYLDNSFSMNAGSLYGNLFDAAKERARKIVKSYNNRQKFVFLTNDMEAKHRIATSKQQMLDFINSTSLSGAVSNFSEIIGFQYNFLNQMKAIKDYRPVFYMLSDFQKVVADFDNVNSDSSSIFYLLPLATNEINNIYIDSCWFSSPGRNLNKNESLNVRVVNNGREDYNDIPIRLFVNGKQKAINNFNINAKSDEIIILNYSNTESGILPSFIEITDYPITYDNKFYFNYKINTQTSILIINNKAENKYLNTLYKSDSSFIIKNTSSFSLRTSEFSNYQVIVLDEPESLSSGLAKELNRFVYNGGVLICLPGEKSNINELNPFFASIDANSLNAIEVQETLIDKINYNHYIYKDVFSKTEEKLLLPKINKYFPVNINSKIVTNILLESSSEKALLVQTKYGKGKLYTFTFPLNLENTDFVLHSLFVPTLYNIAAYSQLDDRLFYTIGRDNIIDISMKPLSGDKTMHIADSEGRTDFIPQFSGIGEMGIRLSLMKSIVFADNYHLKENNQIIQCLSFNYNRKESNIEYYSIEEIEKQLKQLQLFNFKILPAELNALESIITDSLKERKDYWKIFITLALTLLIFEILIIRFLKE